MLLFNLHFDYASSAWYPNLIKKTKTKIQITQKLHSVLTVARQNDSHVQKASLKLLTGYLLKADSINS